MKTRRLSNAERILWTSVTRSITRLRKSAGQEPEAPAAHLEAASRGGGAVAFPSALRSKDRKGGGGTVAKAIPAMPPLAPFGRRLKQSIARGTEPIDARLDLHGMTQSQARGALLGFLQTVQARGGRLVLVITGKGASCRDAGERRADRGVLKRQVPLWLRLPEFRPYVVGFDGAGARHGGEGALYVRLRKIRPGRAGH